MSVLMKLGILNIIIRNKSVLLLHSLSLCFPLPYLFFSSSFSQPAISRTVTSIWTRSWSGFYPYKRPFFPATVSNGCQAPRDNLECERGYINKLGIKLKQQLIEKHIMFLSLCVDTVDFEFILSLFSAETSVVQ